MNHQPRPFSMAASMDCSIPWNLESIRLCLTQLYDFETINISVSGAYYLRENNNNHNWIWDNQLDLTMECPSWPPTIILYYLHSIFFFFWSYFILHNFLCSQFLKFLWCAMLFKIFTLKLLTKDIHVKDVKQGQWFFSLNISRYLNILIL